MLTSSSRGRRAFLNLKTTLTTATVGGGRNYLHQKSRFIHPDGVPAYEDDYVKEAKYPPIDPVWNRRSERANKMYKEYKDWQQSIRKAETIEGKGIQLNLIHRYGYYCFMLGEDNINYDSLQFNEYITRTHTMPQSEFPDRYSSPELLEKVKYYLNKLSVPLLDVLNFEFDGISRRPIEDELLTCTVRREADSVVNQVSRLILQALANEDSYYKDIRVDFQPKTEAFWRVGGFSRSKVLKKIWENREKSVESKNQLAKEDELIERNFQYVGQPLLQIRSKYLLGELLAEDVVPEVGSKSLSRFKHSPQEFYAYKKLRFATNVSGHTSCDDVKCNLISFHSNSHLYAGGQDRLVNPAYQARVQELLLSQAILVNFTKLCAQAHALGFDQFVSLAEPLTSQTVITNGREWSFSAYQLNTMQLDKYEIDDNKKQNICWSSPSMNILDPEGKLNPSVLEMLLKFYLLPTLSDRKEPEMPYLRYSMDELPSDKERRLIKDNYKRIYSLMLLDLVPYPEIHLWEKIYKIRHQKRPMDPRRRFFELPDKNKPYWEKFELHDPDHEPKMLRKLRADLAAKKAEEKLKEVRAAVKAKFHTTGDDEDEEEV